MMKELGELLYYLNLSCYFKKSLDFQWNVVNQFVLLKLLIIVLVLFFGFVKGNLLIFIDCQNCKDFLKVCFILQNGCCYI